MTVPRSSSLAAPKKLSQRSFLTFRMAAVREFLLFRYSSLLWPVLSFCHHFLAFPSLYNRLVTEQVLTCFTCVSSALTIAVLMPSAYSSSLILLTCWRAPGDLSFTGPSASRVSSSCSSFLMSQFIAGISLRPSVHSIIQFSLRLPPGFSIPSHPPLGLTRVVDGSELSLWAVIKNSWLVLVHKLDRPARVPIQFFCVSRAPSAT